MSEKTPDIQARENDSIRDFLIDYERRKISDKLGNVSTLSPAILKKRVDTLRRRRSRLDAERPLRREQDRLGQLEFEQAIAVVRKRLPEARVALANLKADPKNYRLRYSFWDAVFNREYRRVLSPEAASKVRSLEEEEYRLEIALGLEPGPLACPLTAVPTPRQRKFGHVCDAPLRPRVNHEYNLSKEIDLTDYELSICEKALGEQEASLAELEAFKARALQESRTLASRLRLQCSVTDECPYCGASIGDGPRLDHI